MEKTELIEQSKTMMREMSEHVSRIESISIISEKVSAGDVVIMMPGRDVIGLKELTEEQKQSVKEFIRSLLDSNMRKSTNYLECMYAKKAAYNNPEFSKAVSEMVKPETGKTEPGKQDGKIMPSAEELNDLLAKGKKPNEIADMYHCDKSSIYKRMQKYGIKVPTQCKGPEVPVIDKTEEEATSIPTTAPEEKPLDYDSIKRMYVTERMSMGYIADELGVTKKTIHDFIEKEHIYRPTQQEYELQRKTGTSAKVSARS